MGHVRHPIIPYYMYGAIREKKITKMLYSTSSPPSPMQEGADSIPRDVEGERGRLRRRGWYCRGHGEREVRRGDYCTSITLSLSITVSCA